MYIIAIKKPFRRARFLVGYDKFSGDCETTLDPSLARMFRYKPRATHTRLDILHFIGYPKSWVSIINLSDATNVEKQSKIRSFVDTCRNVLGI